MITFQSQFISTATIQKSNKSRFVPTNVSFVEINPLISSDRLSPHRAAILWDKKGGAGYAYDICESINKVFLRNPFVKMKRFFALTSQTNLLEELEPSSILGMVEVTDKKDHQFIDFLQVNPNEQHNSKTRIYKNIGSAILDAIKKMFPIQNILLESDEGVVDFYIANGFQKTGDNDEMIYIH